MQQRCNDDVRIGAIGRVSDEPCDRRQMVYVRFLILPHTLLLYVLIAANSNAPVKRSRSSDLDAEFSFTLVKGYESLDSQASPSFSLRKPPCAGDRSESSGKLRAINSARRSTASPVPRPSQPGGCPRSVTQECRERDSRSVLGRGGAHASTPQGRSSLNAKSAALSDAWPPG